MANDTIIKFTRNAVPEHCADEALIRLDDMVHSPGKPILMKYRDSNNVLRAIFAIGLGSGKGRDNYQVISTRNVRFVNKVVYELSDVSQLRNGEIHLYITEDGKAQLLFFEDPVRKSKDVKGPIIYENLEDGSMIFIGPDGIARTAGDWYTQEETKKILEDYATKGYVDARITERITEIVGGGEITLEGYVKTVNDIAPDEFGNVNINLPDVDGLLSKAEASETYVKTISVNSGEKQAIDITGNIDIDTTDPRLLQEYIDYIESKLKYTYTYGISVTANTGTINLPSSITSITFTATPSVGKSNDMGSKPISVSSTELTAGTGWSSTGNIWTKTVNIESLKENSISSGSIGLKITNSDGKSSTKTASLSVNINKPWFVFETAGYDANDNLLPQPTTAEVKDIVESFINETATPLRTYNKVMSSIKISTIGGERQFVWFAIPSIYTKFEAIQATQPIILPEKKVVETIWGNYTVYRTNVDFNKSEKDIEIKMS